MGLIGLIIFVVMCVLLKRYISKIEYRPVEYELGKRYEYALIGLFLALLVSLLVLAVLGSSAS